MAEHTYLRSCNFLLTKLKENSSKNQTSKSNLTQLTRKIHRYIKQSVKKKRPRRNLLIKSWFYRYFLKSKSRFYRRTLDIFLTQSTTHREGKPFYDRKINNLNDLRCKLYNFSFIKFGTVYITHLRRNTFVTIFQNKELPTRVFQSSTSHQNYTGTKRKTTLARKSTVLAASSFLRYNNFKCVDIIFTRKSGFYFHYLIRGLLRYRIFVRLIQLSRRRSHGATRRKKIRRL
jgi:hypothetical protein